MELYVITSDHSSIPIAEIRTDGKNIDWIIDNTKGKLKHISQGNFEVLRSVVSKSSHLKMTVPEQATVGILRYTLENGDMVEVTTDGKTAMLNGRVMEENEKYGLMSAINSGKLKVKGKADITKPIPLAPRPKIPYRKKAESKVNSNLYKSFSKLDKQQKDEESQNNSRKDKKIDSIDFGQTEYPNIARQLLYLLKYGEDDAK